MKLIEIITLIFSNIFIHQSAAVLVTNLATHLLFSVALNPPSPGDPAKHNCLAIKRNSFLKWFYLNSDYNSNFQIVFCDTLLSPELTTHLQSHHESLFINEFSRNKSIILKMKLTDNFLISRKQLLSAICTQRLIKSYHFFSIYRSKQHSIHVINFLS